MVILCLGTNQGKQTKQNRNISLVQSKNSNKIKQTTSLLKQSVYYTDNEECFWSPRVLNKQTVKCILKMHENSHFLNVCVPSLKLEVMSEYLCFPELLLNIRRKKNWGRNPFCWQKTNSWWMLRNRLKMCENNENCFKGCWEFNCFSCFSVTCLGHCEIFIFYGVYCCCAAGNWDTALGIGEVMEFSLIISRVYSQFHVLAGMSVHQLYKQRQNNVPEIINF